MTPFEREVADRLAQARSDDAVREAGRAFMEATIPPQYSYNFFWAGRPIIQYPQDMAALQEIVWATRPDLIIETGIAHGGSLILSASLLAMLDYCDAADAGEMLDPGRPRRRVLGIDIDIRPHNRAAIEGHPLAGRIEMIEGSAISGDVVAQVHERAKGAGRVMVCLDSNHTHDHVLAELNAYADLVTPGCYCIVFDTVVEDLPAAMAGDRPWGPGDNPKSAVHAWLPDHPDFEIDHDMDAKLLISVAPHGYLRRKG
ncbi:MAG: cephalosporin hydroxylase family protein [Rhodobacteraceae bacterium]|nr:cephalosporin hydroxylase family protein [Paracoccaceae bacterium]